MNSRSAEEEKRERERKGERKTKKKQQQNAILKTSSKQDLIGERRFLTQN